MQPPADHHLGQSLPDDESTTHSSSQIPSPHFQVPHTAPPSLPPETYNLLIHALLSLQGSASHAYSQNSPPTYPYSLHSSPLPNYHLPWLPGTTPPSSAASIAGPSSFYPTNPPIPLPPRATPQGARSPTTAPTAQDTEGTEDAMDVYTSEDKRRRNTAASARFRLKKKLNTLNLEHTVTDLTGRTEELEREATDLRRENAWLKDIVLLKGRNLAVGSQVPASGNRHEDEKDDRTHAESVPESTIKRREKGKGKER